MNETIYILEQNVFLIMKYKLHTFKTFVSCKDDLLRRNDWKRNWREKMSWPLRFQSRVDIDTAIKTRLSHFEF